MRKGQSLVEILLTIGLAALLLPALLVGLYASRSGRAQTEQQMQAYTQMQQMETAVRSIRESGWSAIATDGTYNVVSNGTGWMFAPGSATTNGMTEKVVISDVYRDASGAIVQSGGTDDPSTKEITTTVSWDLPYPSSTSNTFYLTRYLDNFSTVDTTVSDFNAGVLNSVKVTDNSGGEVALGTGGNADWCKPQNSLVNTLTLPKQGNTIVAQPGSAYIGTGDGTQGITFANVSITQPDPPASPAASIVGTYSSSYKTNAIFNDGQYVYLATDGSSSQVLILDLSQTTVVNGVTNYVVVGTISIPSGVGANGIYVSNNIAYVTSSNRLYTYDLTTKTGSHTTPLTSIAMFLSWGENPLAKQVVVANNHAYVGTADTIFGLQAFSVSNGGKSLRLVGVSNLTWSESAQGLVVNATGTRAYIAFNNGGFFSHGFFIVDISQPDPPSWFPQFWPFIDGYSIVGKYNTGSTNPTGMAIASSDRAIIVGTGGSQQYLVVDISNESNPTYCGGLAISSGVFGVSTVFQTNGNAYSYIITGEARDQFKIIQGGAGGTNATSGTFESRIFDASASAAFNRFYADVSQPASTAIKMQVGVAPPVNGSCSGISSFTYLGPNEDPNAYFTPNGSVISAQIPLGSFGTNYVNPAECYRYKVFLSSSDITQTPVLYDVATNYSL